MISPHIGMDGVVLISESSSVVGAAGIDHAHLLNVAIWTALGYALAVCKIVMASAVACNLRVHSIAESRTFWRSSSRYRASKDHKTAHASPLSLMLPPVCKYNSSFLRLTRVSCEIDI